MNVRKLSETSTAITIGWDPVTGQEGYVPTIDGSETLTDGKRHFSGSKTRTQAQIGKVADGQSHSYGVSILGVIDQGVVTSPEPGPPLPSAYTPTLFVSPKGTAANSGSSRSQPTILTAALAKANPGDVIYMIADQGSYETTGNIGVGRSGTKDTPIVLWSDEMAKVHYSGGRLSGGLFQTALGLHDFIFDGLELDGNGHIGMGLTVKDNSYRIAAKHLRIHHMGATGIGQMKADYGYYEDVDVWECGYDQGWSSGISIWSGGAGGAAWSLDNWPGFHTIVNRCRVSGQYDNSGNNSDGNGFIVDGPSAAVLFANCLAYMNGGRGFEDLIGDAWFVNCTSWRNGLDIRIGGGHAPEYQAHTAPTRFANCLAVARKSTAYPTGYAWNYTNASAQARSCLYWNGTLEGLSASLEMKQQDPALEHEPQLAASSPWLNAPAPWALPVGAFKPAALLAGIDPSSMTAAPERVMQLQQVQAADLTGQPRRAFQVGAVAAVISGAA